MGSSRPRLGSGAATCCRAGQSGRRGKRSRRIVFALVWGGNGSVAAVTGHGGRPPSGRRRGGIPRRACPPRDVHARHAAAAHSADTASPLVPSHRSGNRSARRSASSAQWSREPPTTSSTSARTSRCGAVSSSPSATPDSVPAASRRARARLAALLGVGDVEVVGPHDLRACSPRPSGSRARRRSSAGTWSRGRAVLVRRRAEDHVVFDLARDLQAEPRARRFLTRRWAGCLGVGPLGGQDQGHAERGPILMMNTASSPACLPYLGWRRGSGTRRWRRSAAAAAGSAGWRSRG